MLAAPRLPAALKWIEDRRENLMTAGQSRHEHAEVGMAFDDDGDHPGRPDRLRVEDAGAYPTPWPVGRTLVGALFPGPYRVPKASFTTKSHLHQHGRAARRTEGRGVSNRWPGRCCSTSPPARWAWTRSSCAGGTCCAHRRHALHQPQRDAVTTASPRWRTFEQAVEMLDYEAFRHEQAAAREVGRYLGVGTSSYVEPTTPGFGMFATEGATIRIEPSGKVNVYIAGGSTGNSLETTVVQLTADALGVDIEDVATIQGDTALTGYGGGTGGSRSGSMIAGAVGETAAGAPGSHRGHRRAPPRSRRPRTSSWPTAGRASAARPRPTISFAEIAQHRLLPARLAAAGGPGRAWRPPAATSR